MLALANAAVKRIGQRRIRNATDTLMHGADAAGISVAEFIEKAASDDKRHEKFSEVARKAAAPNVVTRLSTVMKRGVNAVTGNLAVGLAAGLATGGLLGPARKTIKCGGCGAK